MIEKDSSLQSVYTVNVQDAKDLKDIEDHTTDMILSLESTLDTVSTLADMYRRYYCTSPNLLKPDDNHAMHKCESDEILIALQGKEKDITYTRKKAEALLTKAQNTRALVSSHLQMQGAKLTYIEGVFPPRANEWLQPGPADVCPPESTASGSRRKRHNARSCGEEQA
jgi:hypothetical protein